MRRITYAINSYHKTGAIYVEYTNLLVFMLGNVMEFICGYLIPVIPLPNISITRDKEKTTLRKYYGDINQLFHLYIHECVLDFCQDRTITKWIDVDYDKLREVFYDNDRKWWDECENRAKEMKEDNELHN